MLFFYDLGIRLYHFLIFIASLKNKKAAAWIQGRKNIFKHIAHQVDNESKHAWFHFASLGEFEQGRPVLEELKTKFPDTSIIITFFSPSGYEIRKDYKLADHVFYLPLDTRRNAQEFIRLVSPSIAVFTKYEYWYHYFEELHKNQIPLFIVSGIFRPTQPFFSWYGGLHRRMLSRVTHFFVQNKDSKALLNGLGMNNITVTGDTRFDRVIKNTSQVSAITVVEQFCGASPVFIAGSTWPQDETLISSLLTRYSSWKFIIAPHEVHPERISDVEKLFVDSVKFSEIKPGKSDKQVLIIDNIGLLSSLYQYGDVAYIGGGFGSGIHNTQEASAFGLPVIFGTKYRNFQEAVDLVKLGASFSIKNAEELLECMQQLEHDGFRARLGKIANEYVAEKAGATKAILAYLEERGLLKI